MSGFCLTGFIPTHTHADPDADGTAQAERPYPNMKIRGFIGVKARSTDL